MSEPRGVPDRSASFSIVVITLVQATLLLLAHEGIDQGLALFADRTFLTVWYTVSIVPLAAVCLLLQSARDRHAWMAGMALAVVASGLAVHTGGDCAPNDDFASCLPVIGPYVLSMAIGHFLLLPFIQGFRGHRWRIPYAALFHAAWDNALTLAATGVFVGAAWLILLLWQGLFGLIGIDFFSTLFSFKGFIYPVTGLLAGFGLLLARHQAGALQAVLRVCLALGRALLPLIGVLTLAYLGTLAFTGVQKLWDTRFAATLLLVLVFGTVSLVNSVLHDGSGTDGYRPALRRLISASLLTLPVYAVLAAIALGLRVAQYGWTVDRFWAATLTFFALAYSVAYAGSVLIPRQGRWLGLLPAANTGVALIIAITLLLTQSPMLDFRAMTVSSQLARTQAEGGSLATLDLAYFRWELGRPGQQALEQLKQDERVSADAEFAKQLDAILTAKNRWQARKGTTLAGHLPRVIPAGTPIPEGLIEYIDGFEGRGRLSCPGQACYLVAVDLGPGPGLEWILAAPQAEAWATFPVFSQQQGAWRKIGGVSAARLSAKEWSAALDSGIVATQASEWRDLRVGKQVLRINLDRGN